MDKVLKGVKTNDDLYQAFKRADGLQRVTALLTKAQTKKRAANIILNEGLSILDAANGEIDLLNEDDTFYVFAHKGYPKTFVDEWPTLPHTIPKNTPLLITEVISNKKPLFIKNIDKLPAKYELGKSFFTATGTHSAALLPLLMKNKLIGVLVFTFKIPQAFARQEKIFMRTLTNQCAQTFERIQAQEKLKKSIKKLREMDRKKDDFISIASHELKTPLTSMKLFLELLSRQLETAKKADQSIHLLKKAQEQTHRLQRLVTDLLDVSRIQKGKLQFLSEPFRLDKLIEDTLDGLSLQHNILIKKTTPLIVKGDKFRIYQVLTNFLTNANKYSPPNSEIHISIEKNDTNALVKVKDFGIGIAQNQQKNIFNKLYQVKNAEKKTYSGLGMGLFIAKEIITHHKGSIGVKSTKGKGATFFFTLPLFEKKE